MELGEWLAEVVKRSEFNIIFYPKYEPIVYHLYSVEY